jgi:hypothetical protein
MLQKACGSFVLMVAGELPGDPEVEKSYSLEEVFAWYQDCPVQIERAVIIGGRLIRPQRRALGSSFSQMEKSPEIVMTARQLIVDSPALTSRVFVGLVGSLQPKMRFEHERRSIDGESTSDARHEAKL